MRQAVVFSSDLADAQMKYLAARAMLEADYEKLERTEALVRIGAASRQEEEVVANHTGHEAEVAAARQRLVLLGPSRDRLDALRQATDVVSEVTITAPNSGTVVTRSINPGQVVAVGQEVFVVADLTCVWAIADLFEKDFANVRVGSEAAVIVPPAGRQLRGKVSYIDPKVDPGSRTAKVRVDVPNADGALRLGMFVDVRFSAPAAGNAIVIPRTAIQSICERSVVYVVSDGDETRFNERSVKPGASSGSSVKILEGLSQDTNRWMRSGPLSAVHVRRSLVAAVPGGA